MPPIIVFSHLRWNFVFQRPQHLLSRLAGTYRFVFVEEPVQCSGPSGFSIANPVPNVEVCTPHTAQHLPGFHDDQLPHLQKLMRQLVARYPRHLAWFYTPMALPLLQEMQPGLVIYDCMDELSAFKNAPKQLLQRENALLKRADLVFTGGPSLYREKKSRHANVHCFPSSVDTAHFAAAREPGAADKTHPSQRHIPGPRLGYYGVIDERFDAALIAALADARPQWQIVLVGPVVKIDPLQLPQRANIHYLGQMPYDALPSFLAGWDVCLLPFALNPSTRFISPTKTLEYLAAEKPVVSTAIADVAQLYGEVVAIAGDTAAFIAACEAALSPAAYETRAWREKTRQLLAATSWDATVLQMQRLIETAQAEGAPAAPASAPAPTLATLPPPPSQPMQRTRHLIIGAGPTGLSAAYHLDAQTVLLERQAQVGGWCRSFNQNGFTFDHAGHIMFSDDPYVLQLYEILLGDNVHWQNREAWVYSKNVFTRYPFQGALYGLPPSVIRECIMGAIEARYGRPADGKCEVAATGIAQVSDCCGDGSLSLPAVPAAVEPSFLPARASAERKPANFEEFIYQVWGAGIARHFAIPYNRKLWTVPLSEMETSWLDGRVPLPDLQQIIDGALQPVGRPMGPNARFGYPLRGGFQALMTGFLPHIKGRLLLNAEVGAILPAEHQLMLTDGRRYQYEQLISTMPLPALVRQMGSKAPPEVRAAALGLRHVSVRCVNLGIAREHITDKHWIYYPEESVFHRIFVQGNASPACNPPGGFGLTCEISYSASKLLPCEGQQLIELCRRDCIRVGLLRADDRLLAANQVDLPYAYVLYDHARARNVALIRQWLSDYDILLAGRYSEWEYYNSDHAFLAGKKAAQALSWAPPKAALAE